MKTAIVKVIGAGFALVAAAGIGVAQPWNLRVASPSGVHQEGRQNGSDVGAHNAGPVQHAGRDAAGHDLSIQHGSGNVSGSKIGNDTGNRTTTQSGPGGKTISGRDTTTRTNVGNKANSDNDTTTRNTSTRDRHDSPNQSGSANVNGDNNHQTVNNLPPARPDPPTGGVASIAGVAAADGGATMNSTASITVRVNKLPNNGNTLFLVCELLGNGDEPNLYFAKAELTELGTSSVLTQFGGALAHDPALIGTVRLCGIASANRSAGNVLRMLMLQDQRGEQNDPDGHPYDWQRIALPDGSSMISTTVSIRVQRV